MEWLGLGGTLNISTSSSSKPSAMGRDTFHSIRLLWPPSNVSLNISRDGNISEQDSATCIQKKGALFIPEAE